MLEFTLKALRHQVDIFFSRFDVHDRGKGVRKEQNIGAYADDGKVLQHHSLWHANYFVLSFTTIPPSKQMAKAQTEKISPMKSFKLVPQFSTWVHRILFPLRAL